MGEILKESPTSDKAIIAVAVGSSKSSMYPLKWAIDNLATPGSSLHLIHVYPPLRYIPASVSKEALEQFKQQQRIDLGPTMKKYESYCRQKKVKPVVSLVENDSVSKALVDHITRHAICMLVIGHTPRNKLASAFSAPTKSNYVMKNSPDFCTVMTIHKDKLVSQDSNEKPSQGLSGFLSDGIIGSDTPGREIAKKSGSGSDSWRLGEGDMNSKHYSFNETSPITISSIISPNKPYSIGSGVSLRDMEQDSKDQLIGHGSNVNALQQQLNDARRETQTQVLLLERAEASLSSIMKTNTEYNAQRREEASLKEAALHKLELAREQSNEQKKNVEALTKSLQASQQEVAILRNLVVEEKKNLAELVAAQTATKQEASMLINLLAEEKKMQEAMEDSCKAAKQEADILRNLLNEEKIKQKLMSVALEDAQQELAMLKNVANEEKRRCEEAINVLRESKKETEMDRLYNATLSAELEKALKSFKMDIQLHENVKEKALKEGVIMKEMFKSQQKYIEYTFQELLAATDSFSKELKLGEGGYGCVYKGLVQYSVSAIKVLKLDGHQGNLEFEHEVELWSRIHHPHIVVLLGACFEKSCVVYEYMENGSLEDHLSRKKGFSPLPWYIRFRVCYEVALALMFLHSSQPDPIIHTNLKPANILLDRNFVCKISDIKIARSIPKNDNRSFNITKHQDTVLPISDFSYIDPDYQRTGTFSPFSDVYALGIIILQILTGKPAIGVESLTFSAFEREDFSSILDTSAGDWPIQEAKELALVGLGCAEPQRRDRMNLPAVLSSLKDIAKVAELAATSQVIKKSSSSLMESVIPSLYICPLSQEVMKKPHIAADGFTYEEDCIKSWLSKHNTSPMTNLELEHKFLTPNHSLQSAIRDWKLKSGTGSQYRY